MKRVLTMPDIHDELRLALATSSRWRELIDSQNIPVMNLGTRPRIRVEDWTFEQCQLVRKWMRHERECPDFLMAEVQRFK